MIRLFIEGQELDVNEGFTHQITYAVDDIRNIDSKATSFSKTIVLPGTSNNNKLLGNIFEFANSNFTDNGLPNVGYNFNASISAKVLVEINGLIILKGVIRLMEIIIDGENIEYEVALFGELGGFVSKLANKKLQDLDFSVYNHIYNGANIIASWEQTDIDPVDILFDGTNKTIKLAVAPFRLFPNETFEILNSTNNNGIYTVVSTSFDEPYKELIIIVKENVVTETSNTATIKINNKGSGYYYPLIDYGKVSTNKLDYFYITFRPALFVREYIDKIITGAGYTYESDFFNTAFFKRLIVPNNDPSFLRKELSDYINGDITTGQTISLNQSNYSTLRIYKILFNNPTLTSFTYSNGIFTYTGALTRSANIKLNFVCNVTQKYNARVYLRVVKNINGVSTVISSNELNVGVNSIQLNLNVDIYQNDTITFIIETLRFSAQSNPIISIIDISGDVIASVFPSGFIDYQIGDEIDLNDTIPENIMQKDFFTSIVKMFNLMITEDKYRENHLIIEPWVDFYNLNRSTYLDWSDKLDRSEPIRIKPMSEINSRFYDFKYKSDSDYYNDKYKKKYNEGYGDRKFDNQLEFAKETSSSEVIFSATPLVGYENKDKIVSTIFKWDGTTTDKEEQVSSNIRILQAKKITGVAAWDILADNPFIDTTPGNIANGTNLTAYGYAGHLDDPDVPNADINFGATQELYFTLASGALSNNMFNAYYSPYMAEITDKDSRLFTGKFKLNEKDIFNLDFGRFIWIDGVLYRLIKIYDYSEGELCKVDLLRVIYTTY